MHTLGGLFFIAFLLMSLGASRIESAYRAHPLGHGRLVEELPGVAYSPW